MADMGLATLTMNIPKGAEIEPDTNLLVLEAEPSTTSDSATKVSALQVSSEQAEASISDMHLGERIKHLRLKKSMGLVELGRHTGLSASFLSQLETGRVVPTLRNLTRIAMVFSVDLSYFFQPEPQMLFRIHRSKDRTRLPQSGVDDPTYFFENLGLITPDRSLDPYFAEFLPQAAGHQPKAHQHAGSEFLYVVAGELNMRYGEETHRVGSGDGVFFDATTTHSYVCASEQPAKAVIITMKAPPPESSRDMSGSGSNNRARMRPNRQAS